MLDIFNGDAFSIVAMTDRINKMPYVPGRISAMGLFTEQSVRSLTIAIDERNGVLGLVPPTPRGGPGVTIPKQKGVVRAISIPHFEIDDAVYADEVQGVREFGSESNLASVQSVVDGRLAEHAMRHDYTLEANRVGAVMGIITYADGSTLDLFATFGVTQPTEVAFDLTAASPQSGAVRRKAQEVVRTVTAGLQMGAMGVVGVRALCSDAFFDDLIANAEVRSTYLQTVQAQELRGGYAYREFYFGDIVFENYRGASLVGMHADKAYFYPVGVPGIFKTYYAPADYVETVNTLGLPRYAKQFRMDNDKGIRLETQTNNLNLCLRPLALVRGRRGS